LDEVRAKAKKYVGSRSKYPMSNVFSGSYCRVTYSPLGPRKSGSRRVEMPAPVNAAIRRA